MYTRGAVCDIFAVVRDSYGTGMIYHQQAQSAAL